MRGIEALVNMSQISAREQAKSALAFQHWQAEQILDWAGIGAIHIRPTFFAEDLYLFSGLTIAAEGRLYLPYGAGTHAPVAAVDIARVVSAILDAPAAHVGQRHVVTGPRDMGVREMAEILTAELGKPVTYVDLPVAQWRDILVTKAGMPPFLADHLAAVAVDHQNGIFSAQTDVVSRIGGPTAPVARRIRPGRTRPRFCPDPPAKPREHRARQWVVHGPPDEEISLCNM